jgi:hypothetical protein
LCWIYTVSLVAATALLRKGQFGSLPDEVPY